MNLSSTPSLLLYMCYENALLVKSATSEKTERPSPRKFSFLDYGHHRRRIRRTKKMCRTTNSRQQTNFLCPSNDKSWIDVRIYTSLTSNSVRIKKYSIKIDSTNI